jgi:hypothetical protein
VYHCKEQLNSFVLHRQAHVLVIRGISYIMFDKWLRYSDSCCKVVPELEQFQRRYLPPDTPLLELPIPRCYHARYTQGRDSPNSSPIPSESVLVLENLKSRGFQGADFSRGLTLRQAESALEAVARLHALSLALKVNSQLFRTTARLWNCYGHIINVKYSQTVCRSWKNNLIVRRRGRVVNTHVSYSGGSGPGFKYRFGDRP